MAAKWLRGRGLTIELTQRFQREQPQIISDGNYFHLIEHPDPEADHHDAYDVAEAFLVFYRTTCPACCWLRWALGMADVAANQPVSLDMHVKAAPNGAACGRFRGTFTPEASKECEVTLDVRGGECRAVVQETRKDEQGQAGLTGVTLLPTFKCR